MGSPAVVALTSSTHAHPGIGLAQSRSYRLTRGTSVVRPHHQAWATVAPLAESVGPTAHPRGNTGTNPGHGQPSKYEGCDRGSGAGTSLGTLLRQNTYRSRRKEVLFFTQKPPHCSDQQPASRVACAWDASCLQTASPSGTVVAEGEWVDLLSGALMHLHGTFSPRSQLDGRGHPPAHPGNGSPGEGRAQDKGTAQGQQRRQCQTETSRGHVRPGAQRAKCCPATSVQQTAPACRACLQDVRSLQLH